MVQLELSILTFNVWGIPLVSADRTERMQHIGKELSSGKYDIVTLQEVWTEKDSATLQLLSKAVLPYAYYFYSGVIGSGLLVLSKYPIVSSLFHSWSVNGYCHRIQHADWFGGKGVGMCRIRVGDLYVHVYNAHLHAEYSINNDDYKTHRVIQSFDTAQFIEATRWDAALQVLAGDLNTKPTDISYKILLYTSEMKDTCNSDTVTTNECKQNSYTSKKVLAHLTPGIRIDHIFVKSSDNIKTSILEYKLPLPDRVPGQKYSYSDHEAVQVRLRLQLKNEGDTCSISHCNASIEKSDAINENEETIRDVKLTLSQTSVIANSHSTALEGECCIDESRLGTNLAIIKESIKLCDEHLKNLKIDRIFYFTIAAFLLACLIVISEFPVTVGYRTLILLLKLVLFTIILFCIFMGTIWNLMERNGILSGKSSMEIKLQASQYANLKRD